MTAADISFVLTVLCLAGLLGSLCLALIANDTDAVEDFDHCIDCDTPLTDDNRATSCGDHPLCTGCDWTFNPCNVCRYWRRVYAS